MTTADRLRALTAEATPGPWAWHMSEVPDSPGTLYNAASLDAWKDWYPRYVAGEEDDETRPELIVALDAYGRHAEGYVETSPENARLIALAPDLAAWAARAADAMRDILSSPTGGGWQCHSLLADLDRIMEER